MFFVFDKYPFLLKKESFDRLSCVAPLFYPEQVRYLYGDIR